MTRFRQVSGLLVVLTFVFWTEGSEAQDALLLDGSALTRVMPTSFYFEGLSGPTQMRNATAVRFGEKRHVIVALVDTAGYSSEVRAKYEGFVITDSKVSVGDKEVGAGAYGFGVTKDSKFNLFDVGGNLLDLPQDEPSLLEFASDLACARMLSLLPFSFLQKYYKSFK